MSSSAQQGQCCVCGTATNDRCSACANAGFDLFFCSREHQKLVWSGHKLSCGMGGRDKPFRFLPLTPTELTDALGILKGKDGLYLKERLYLTLPEAYEKNGAEAVLEFLARPMSPGTASLAAVSAAIYEVRGVLLDDAAPLDRTYSPSTLTSHARRALSPLSSQSTITGLFAQPLLEYAEESGGPFDAVRAFPLHDPLYVEFNHRLLIKAAIHELVIDSPPTADEQTMWRRCHIHLGVSLENAVDSLCAKYPAQGKALQSWSDDTRQKRKEKLGDET